MAMDRIGVGIIGVTPGRSWAANAHMPALRALPDYEVRALSTTRRESADAAAAALGVPLAFDNHLDLVNAPGVDLVAVTVKVPHHLELVKAAIAAGKHVFCEWPLGNGLAEAEEMAALARQRGVIGAIGLQARAAPLFLYVRDLIAEGYVGEVLSTSLVATGSNWGPEVNDFNAYTYDKVNGATMLTIPFGHVIDAVCMCLGEFEQVMAMQANRRTSATVIETGERIAMTAEDQVLVTGRLAGGAMASVHYRGGMVRGNNFLWEINGTEGDLVVTGDVGHGQIFPLQLAGGRGDDARVAPMEIPARYLWTEGLPVTAVNVAQLYALLARDIREGTRLCPDFDVAVARHRMIQAVEEATASGCCQPA